MRVLILMAPVAVVASGCGSLLVSKAPAPEVIWLDPPAATASVGGPADGASLRVTVEAAPGLDTDSVLVLDAGRRLRPLGSAQWPDHLPEVFETLARQSLESSGHFRRVVGRHDAGAAEAELALELRRFFGIADEADRVQSVVVDVAASLRCSPTADRFVVSASAPVPVPSHEAVIDAYRGATSDALTQLADRVAAGGACERAATAATSAP